VSAYVDASVLLRVAPGDPTLSSSGGGLTNGVSSALIQVECLRTLDRLRLRASLPDKEVALHRSTILSLIASLEIVEIDGVILDRAAQPMPIELGTLDAIHLATTLLWKESTHSAFVMATHDGALALGAQAHGLAVVGVPLL
jgi:predicted nucleic acid-binding protein